jgi:hypothetical protein
VANQHHADDDVQEPGDPQPDAVLLSVVEHPDQVEEARDDHEDADQDGDHVERA